MEWYATRSLWFDRLNHASTAVKQPVRALAVMAGSLGVCDCGAKARAQEDSANLYNLELAFVTHEPGSTARTT